ncbi:hypothetical protein HJC23_013263 [Cyclotella cryptica]|uniref:Nudix hydrolase domain-containing protein n=1 Tax=Cyclotella cryptica TaxID=29204 RepID=A0ABD3PFS8_9STRA|eukprot:CCRYP_014928-RA/>CCRYP_014928-RA protein AED:0.03 eAED:0.03 QI:0/-1/0/1/-1/1/1/0/280
MFSHDLVGMPPSRLYVGSTRRLAILSVKSFSILLFLCYALNFEIATLTKTIKDTHTASSGEYLTVYKLPDSFMGEPRHLTPIDPRMLIPLGNESIDSAHRNGRLHTGSILFVMDVSGRFLLLKRSASVVTCPETWSIVGEHSVVGEDPSDVPLRALKEELGLLVANTIVTIHNLTDLPLYYIRHYGARNGYRIDRQLTYLWLVKLNQAQEEVRWTLDHEVADHKWITLDELDVWLREDTKNDEHFDDGNKEDDGPPNGAFCHYTIRSLLRTGIDRLKVIL